MPDKPRVWSDTAILPVGGMPNLDLAPDGERFVVFGPGEAEREGVRVTMLLNFFDELRRRK